MDNVVDNDNSDTENSATQEGVMWAFFLVVILIVLIILLINTREKVHEVERRLDSLYPSLKDKITRQTELINNFQKQINELNAKIIDLIGKVKIFSKEVPMTAPEDKPVEVPVAAPEAEVVPSPIILPPVQPVEAPAIKIEAIPAAVPGEVTIVEQVPQEAIAPAIEPAVTRETLTPEPVPVEEIPLSQEEEEEEAEAAEPAVAFHRPFETYQKTPPKISPKAPPPSGESKGFEVLLGAKGFVWIGAIAFGLAGILLVKWSIDMGYITPTVRVAMGIIFGVLLLGMGEWLRRSSEYVSQGLSASGIAVLFASFLSAMNLHQLITKPVGFIFLALTTAAAVVLSLRQGPLIAIIALIGGLFTPYWVRTGVPRPGSLFSYLFLLESGLLVVTRKKQWWYLAGLTLTGGMLWVIIWMDQLFKPVHAVWIGLFLLLTFAAFLAAGLWKNTEDAWGNKFITSALNFAAVIASAILMAVLAGINNYGTKEWIFLSILSIGCLFLARKIRDYLALAWIPATIVLGLMIVWTTQIGTDINRFYWTLALEAVLFGLGSYILLWNSETPAIWASLSSSSAIAFLMVGYWCHERTKGTFHWGIVCIISAAVFVILCVPVVKKFKVKGIMLSEEGAQTLAILAIAVTFFVTLAVPIELKRQWISVSWAMEVVALVWIAKRLRVPALDKLSYVLIALVMFRLVVNPKIFMYPIGTLPVINWLLYGYGIPIVSFIIAAYLTRREEKNVLSAVLQWCSIVLTIALVCLEIHHYFHPEQFSDYTIKFTEWGTFVIAWLLLSLSLFYLHSRLPLTSLIIGAKIKLVIGSALALFVLMLAQNPLWNSISVGKIPVINLLLFAYGIPAIVLLILSHKYLRDDKHYLLSLSTIMSVMMIFVLVSLQLRQALHGEFLNWRTHDESFEFFEWSTLIICWVLLFFFLQFIGSRLRLNQLAIGGTIILYGAIAMMGIILLVARNPLWTSIPVGKTLIFNQLLYAYGIPVILMLVAARRYLNREKLFIAPICSVTSVVMFFWLVTTEIRQGFHGEFLQHGHTPSTELAEWGTYIIAWVLLFFFLQFVGSKLSLNWLITGGTFILIIAVTAMYGILLGVKNPLWASVSAGETPVFNQLLYAYGIPVILLLFASRAFRGEERAAIVPLCSITSTVMLFSLVTLEIRQAFHGAFLNWRTHDNGFEFTEWGTYIIFWALLFFALQFLGSRLADSWLTKGGMVILGIAVIMMYTVMLIARNPLWTAVPVGQTLIFNQLLYAYGIPVILLLVAVRRYFQTEEFRKIRSFLSITNIIMLFWMVTMEVRQAFHGELLNRGALTDAEKYAYSIAWILFGSILLVLGMVRKSQVLRYSSLAIIFLTIAKVFLYDTANLGGLWRVLSLFGLGVCLFIIAHLYRKYVFKV